MDPKILIPVDDSPTAQATIAAIIDQKQRFPKKLHILHVINKDQLAYKMIPDFQVDMVRQNAEKAGNLFLNKVAVALSEHGFEVEKQLEFGSPRETISNIANQEGFQMVVIGRHEGSGEIKDVIFGSVANFVLHNVSCPVLLF